MKHQFLASFHYWISFKMRQENFKNFALYDWSEKYAKHSRSEIYKTLGVFVEIFTIAHAPYCKKL